MKSFIILILILFGIKLYAHPKDSLRLKRHCIELKAGAVFFLRGEGDEYRNAYMPKDKVKGRYAETFNLSISRRMNRKFSFGFAVDDTKYNLVGEPRRVGYQLYKSSKSNDYFITQDISYFNLSLGTFATFNIKIKKVSLDLGASVYWICYQSPVTVKNYYVGEQPVYPDVINLPQEGPRLTIKSRYDPWDIDNIPYFGINLNLCYDVQRWCKLKLFTSCFYQPDVQLTHGSSYMDRSMLPQNYAYYIEKQYWLSSGLAISVSF